MAQQAHDTTGGTDRITSYSRFRSVRSGAVRWTQGFWAERFALCRDVVIHSMREALEVPENAAYLGNLRVAAGLEKDRHRGRWWSDGDCYKWLEAVARVYEVTRDPGLDRLLDEWIAIIAQAQAADGYISTQIQLSDRGRWTDLRHHELYNMGHLLTAACVHHRVTGKDSFLNVARKTADYLYGVFHPRPPELAHFGFNPSQIMGLVDLYRATGEPRYLELAGIFVSNRGSAPGGTDQNQDRVPLRQESEAVGHAVTATYLYCGAADVYAETGETALLDALRRIWEDMVSRKMYVTGGVGALHHGESKRRDSVHEAFAREYHLPNATAYNETCANIGNAMWSWRMLQITGEARYADVMEQVLYNSGLSGMSIDGKRFFYTNPLRWHGTAHPLLSSDSHGRWFTFGCYCCPPQVARTLASVQEWAYGLSDEGVWVHLYGGSVLDATLPDGAAVELEQQTDYPWDGQVRITLRHVARPFALMLRIPSWAEEAELRVNGQPAGVEARPGSYARIERAWAPGDVVELSLPMRVRLMEADPRVEETRNQIAVMRGPVVYCLESVDLPASVPLAEVHLPRDIRLTPRHAPDVLGGLTVLEGEAVRLSGSGTGGPLYDELATAAAQTVSLALIPYYAWANRGEGEMTVWIPLA